MAALFAGAAFTSPLLAQTTDKWGAHLDLEGKVGTERNLGEGGLFLPLYQTLDTLIFGDLRMRFDDNESHEANVGAGIRRMLGSGWNIGGYGYFDRRESPYDNYFNQITVGAEALGRDFDLRLNGYWTIGDRSRAVDSLNAASISGTSIILRGGEERSMSGFDAEVGWRAPIFDAEAPQQLRFYAGGYRFTADGVDDVAGPRLRADVTFEELPFLWEGSRLSLGAEWQYDDPRGSQAFVGIRLRIPLQRESRAPRLNAQERRMTDTVIRDIDVVTQAGAFGAPETVTQLANGTVFTVINSASTAGNDLDAAVTAAGSNSTVILSGTFQTTGSNTVSLAFGQTLMAGSVDVRSASGKVATLNGSAAINGTNVNASAVQVNAGGTLSGLTITNDYSGGAGGRAVIVAGGAGNTTIINNTIAVTQSGNNGAAALTFGNNTSGTVTGNRIVATGSGAATTMTALGINSGATTVTVSGNSLSASGGTTNIMANVGNATINAGSTENVRGSGSCTGAPASGVLGFTDGTTCP